MHSQEVTGLLVINIIDGTKVGTIAHLYLDLAAQQVVGFAIAPDGGWFGGKVEPAPTIAASAVRSLGPDALTVDNLEASHAAWVGATDGTLLTVDQLAGRPVVTASGAARRSDTWRRSPLTPKPSPSPDWRSRPGCFGPRRASPLTGSSSSMRTASW
jgi:sporulation protein YlmC with PRC-barrel domain